ncbi:hypothetical protein [Roseimicrobium sp. ORNL1]|uniref:hypothetical protein n=1 Tax=Roseimicrobium sp. ORNL1 TaxID=2711231 RepID=UPI0013E1C220|nr:hypothetical protein [Roseimicrobium sp. ORNL1]QIF00720.1 hypothetical protein G5S37_04015 [Roseimicrobium sp. ORNL1]
MFSAFLSEPLLLTLRPVFGSGKVLSIKRSQRLRNEGGFSRPFHFSLAPSFASHYTSISHKEDRDIHLMQLMNLTFTPLLCTLSLTLVSLLTGSLRSNAQAPAPLPQKQREFLLDTKAATFEGIRFKQDGADVIAALFFNAPEERAAAVRKFTEFMEPPRKKANLAVQVPGNYGITLRFNAYNGQFAQLQVNSDNVKTTEGLGVGSRFEDFVAKYGEPQVRESPNNPTLYSFSTSNPGLAIVLHSKDSPVQYFMAAYDLRK